MGSKAKPAKNTLFQRGDGATPEVFTTIAEVLSSSGPKENMGTIDVTSQDSEAQEVIPDGLLEAGEVSLEVLFIGADAQQQGLRSDLRAGTLRNFKIVYNDHVVTKTTAPFAAYVTGFDGPSFSKSEAYKASITLKRTGLPAVPTYAPAA